MGFLLRQALLSFLFALLPMDVLVRMTVVVLRRLSKKTKTTLDDELVHVLEKQFNIEEIKDDHN